MKIFLSILFGILILWGSSCLLYPYAELCFLLAPMTIGILLIKKTSCDLKMMDIENKG